MYNVQIDMNCGKSSYCNFNEEELQYFKYALDDKKSSFLTLKKDNHDELIMKNNINIIYITKIGEENG